MFIFYLFFVIYCKKNTESFSFFCDKKNHKERNTKKNTHTFLKKENKTRKKKNCLKSFIQKKQQKAFNRFLNKKLFTFKQKNEKWFSTKKYINKQKQTKKVDLTKKKSFFFLLVV